jgi:hypothetical protein
MPPKFDPNAIVVRTHLMLAIFSVKAHPSAVMVRVVGGEAGAVASLAPMCGPLGLVRCLSRTRSDYA